MNSMVTRTDPNVREFPAIGPGERLRAARLARDLDLQHVAAELHLTTTTVNALENDEYDSLPARVFVRGYIKNYARLVDLPEDAIVQLFDDHNPVPEQAPTLHKAQAPKIGVSVPRVYGGLVQLITWLIVIVTIALFVLWWKGYLSTVDEETTLPLGSETEQNTELSESVLAPPGALPLPAPSDAPLSAPGGNLLPLPPAGPVPEAPEPTDSGAAPPPTDADLVPPAGTTGGVLPLPINAPEVVGEAALPAAETAAGNPGDGVAAVPAGIVIEFSGDCWVDVRDRDRRYKLIGKMSKGDRRTLEGQPPYEVVFGNVSAVRVTIDGKPFDVGRFARGNVARFTLDPQS